MEWIGKGIGMGLLLSILVGPLLFALVKEGLERGFRAGVSVGLGIWVSDLLLITLTYFSVATIATIIEADGFQWTMGIGGSLVLFTIGAGTFLSRPSSYKKTIRSPFRGKNYLSLAFKGFLINTINPFTIAFWTGLMTTVVLKEDLSSLETGSFFGSIFLTIILTDTLKVVMAKKIRPYMKPRYLHRIRQVAGVALILFGIVMLGRVLFV